MINNSVLQHIETNKGVRIGATSGESITMNGDDLYVKGRVEIDDFLVLGSNGQSGLSTGDINASTIYYNALIAKSPTFLCSADKNWCEVTVPEYKQKLYLQYDPENWNILNINFNNQDYTPSQFINNICSVNSEREDICNQIISKVQTFQDKKQKERAYKLFTDTCADSNGEVEGTTCTQTSKSVTTYENAIQIIQMPLYEKIAQNCTQLNESLQIETYTCYVDGSITGYDQKYEFKDNCYWTEQEGYVCETKTILSTYNE